VTVRNRGGRAVLADVARQAEVSMSTASKILNNVASVSVRPQTRQRVLDVAAELGYRPHVTARALAGGASHALALLVPELTNPVHAKMIRSAFRTARDLGYTVLVAEDPAGARTDDSFADLVAAGHADGILIGSARPGHPLVADLRRRGIPHVFVNRPVPGSGRNVGMDVAAAGALAVAHFAGLGHRVVGHVGGPADLETSRTRTLAFRTAARRFGLTEAPVSHVPFDERSGAEAAEALVREHPGLTAIYATSLGQAVGVVHTVHRLGLRIPQDISVLAYDDLPLAEFLSPPLDTVAMPLTELGAAAVHALVEQIGGAEPADVQVPIAPELVLRGSSAPPRG
jgi:DNA-binding LacI/PurR family transcriptional regulator